MHLLKLLTFSFVFFLSRAALSQYNRQADKQVDALFASYTSKTPGAAVAIVKDGKIIFQKGYGMANLEHGRPITPQTVFNIASVSKQFTAFAIYLLESEGKLSFEDDIRKYLTELPDYGTVIKVRHLLAHTSGLRDQLALLNLAGWRMDDVITTDQILKLLVRQKGLNFTPGTQFGYSNTGYTLLAEIVRRVSGKTLAAYTKERIFQPLGMHNTRFEESHETLVKNRAESYELVNGVYQRKPINVSNPGPSNLLTTVEDLVKWTMNFEKPVVGNEKLLKAFHDPSYLDDGSKVFLRIIDGDTLFHAKGQNFRNYRGVRMISHGGHTAGFRTYMARFPDQQLAIVALSNDEHNENLNARWQIADFYLKGHMQQPRTNATSSQATTTKPTGTYQGGTEEFWGEYHNDELRTSYSFKTRGDKLVMCHDRLSDVELVRTGPSKFSGSGSEAFLFELEFQRSERGTITGFLISNFGVKFLRFTKAK